MSYHPHRLVEKFRIRLAYKRDPGVIQEPAFPAVPAEVNKNFWMTKSWSKSIFPGVTMLKHLALAASRG